MLEVSLLGGSSLHRYLNACICMYDTFISVFRRQVIYTQLAIELVTLWKHKTSWDIHYSKQVLFIISLWWVVRVAWCFDSPFFKPCCKQSLLIWNTECVVILLWGCSGRQASYIHTLWSHVWLSHIIILLCPLLLPWTKLLMSQFHYHGGHICLNGVDYSILHE